MGKRHSIQRLMITEVMKRMDHPTAQDMAEEIRKEYPYLSLGTVYRNLNLLVEEGVVRRLSAQDSADRFETRQNPHCHIRCNTCGRYFDIEEADLCEGMDKKIEAVTGFLVESHTICFYGTCPSCRGE